MPMTSDKRVLVVDDEEDVVYFLCTALEDAGFQTDSASSVDEALRKIAEAPPDAISLDMVMPGKSGIVLFHELHRHPEWRKIPVLFVTGHAKDERVKKDLDAASALAASTLSGPATYLDKPVTAEKFIQAVAGILKVDLPTRAPAGRTDAEDLRRQVKGLLEGADEEALREALRLLKSRE
ncbi:MAG: response regulator [Acidobacteriota bacterium]